MMSAGSDEGRTEAGPFGEEAARLLGAAQDWLHRVVLDPSTAKVATGSAECCWCPLCQLVAAARGNRGQLSERWSDTLGALTELQAALAGLLRPAGEPPADRPPRTVHRIDLSDETEPAAPAEPAAAEPTASEPTPPEPTPPEPAASQPPAEPAEPTQPAQPDRPAGSG